MESLDSAYSKNMREKLNEWFFKDLMKVGQADGMLNVIVIGTVLHPDSLLSHLLNNPGWKSFRYKAILHEANNKHLWDHWRKLLTDMADPHREMTADSYYESHKDAMLAGSKVLWPEVESYKSLMEMRVLEGEAAFLSEKQNIPYNPDRMIFNMAEASRFSFDISTRTLQTSHGTIELRNLKHVVAYHDPAMAKSSESDYAAIVVVGIDTVGRMYVLDAAVEKMQPDAQIQKAYELASQWGFSRIHIESNGFQALFTDLYKTNKPSGIPPLSVVETQQTANKVQRISTLQPYIANGHLAFSENLPKTFLEQMMLFPTANDDGPDALQGAVAQLLKQYGNPLSMKGVRATGAFSNKRQPRRRLPGI